MFVLFMFLGDQSALLIIVSRKNHLLVTVESV